MYQFYRTCTHTSLRNKICSQPPSYHYTTNRNIHDLEWNYDILRGYNFFFFLWIWTILKVFLVFVTILLLFSVTVFLPCGIILDPRWGLEPAALALEGAVLTTGLPGKSLGLPVFRVILTLVWLQNCVKLGWKGSPWCYIPEGGELYPILLCVTKQWFNPLLTAHSWLPVPTGLRRNHEKVCWVMKSKNSSGNKTPPLPSE